MSDINGLSFITIVRVWWQWQMEDRIVTKVLRFLKLVWYCGSDYFLKYFSLDNASKLYIYILKQSKNNNLKCKKNIFS